MTRLSSFRLRPRLPAALVVALLAGACVGEQAQDRMDVEGGTASRASAGAGAGAERGAAAGRDVAELHTLTGLYVSGVGAPVFTACGTDGVRAVVEDEAGRELERRVRLEAGASGAPVRVTLVGRTVEGPPEAVGEGAFSGLLRVQEVLAVHGDEACPEAPAGRPLEETAWQLSGLPEPEAAVVAAGAWMRLRGDVALLEGFTGCRDLSGRFEWSVTRLRFSGLDATAAMCPAADVHADLLEALAQAGSYRIRGDTLELLGEAGAVATLRASGR